MSTEAIAIRRATPDDASVLADLRFEFRTSLRPPAEGRQHFIERCTKWMHARLSDATWLCWVADHRNALVGTIWLHLIEKIPNPGPEDELHGYITNAYVQESMRNQGLGTLLLDAALAHCRANRVDSVILWPSDESRSLYERHGFGPADNVMLAVTGANAYLLSKRQSGPGR